MTQPTHPVPGPWTIRYELATNPLTLNASRQGSFRKNATWTKKIRRQTESRVERIHNIPVLGRCVVQLTWFVLTNGRRDVDNLAKLEKAMFDGVVDAGIVVDDIPQLMTKLRPRIVKVEKSDDRSTAWMELSIARATDTLLIVGTSGEQANAWAEAHGLLPEHFEHIGSPDQLAGRSITRDQPLLVLPAKSRAKAAVLERAALLAALWPDPVEATEVSR